MAKSTLRFIIGAILCVPFISYAETITIRADNWFPMNGDPGAANPGYMIEIAQKIFATAGHKVDYKTMPWKRALEFVEKGKFDCVVGAYKEDAPNFVFPSKSWGYDQPAFFVKKGNSWKYKGISSLDAIKLGVIGDYHFDDEFDKYVADNKKKNVQSLKTSNALDQNIKKILGGRIDATIESKVVMQAKLKELGKEGEVVEAGNLLSEPSPIYIACSPAKPLSKELIKIIDEQTPKLRASGELQKILDKYGLKDWK